MPISATAEIGAPPQHEGFRTIKALLLILRRLRSERLEGKERKAGGTKVIKTRS